MSVGVGVGAGVSIGWAVAVGAGMVSPSPGVKIKTAATVNSRMVPLTAAIRMSCFRVSSIEKGPPAPCFLPILSQRSGSYTKVYAHCINKRSI